MATVLETYSDVVDEVLNFGFNDGPQVNRERIKKWVNEGQFQIARQVEAPEFQATEVVTLEQGVYQYSLPEDFLRLQDIYYPELVTRLRPIDLQQFDMAAPKKFEGPPETYTIYKQSELWLFPTPNNSTDTLEVRYIRRPTILVADADVPTLNKDYLHLLVGYAKARAFEAEDDLEAAQAHINRYKQDLDSYASDVQWRVADRPRTLDGSWSGSGYSGRVI